MIKGIFLILLFLFLGEGCSYLINGLVPGSVLGMILLFLSLFSGIVKADDVRSVSRFLTGNMALFFVPASIGVIASWPLLSKNWIALTVISIVTTIVVIVTVALIQEKAENRKANKKIPE
ncbi:MAG: CidA/LrgA family protein [Bacteroidales bacterium]